MEAFGVCKRIPASKCHPRSSQRHLKVALKMGTLRYVESIFFSPPLLKFFPEYDLSSGVNSGAIFRRAHISPLDG